MNNNDFRRKPDFLSVILLAGLFFSPALPAQHSHGILTPGVTFPQDNSVLAEPPQLITMSFQGECTTSQIGSVYR